MPAVIAPPITSSPRTFAEFFASHSCHDLSMQIQRLPGANYLGFAGDRRNVRLQFGYRGQIFFIKEAGRSFHFQVNSSDCPERILWEVQSHFAALLSPGLRD